MKSFSTKEITEFFKKARRVFKHPGLDVLILPKINPQARLLVVTPKRTGNAPERNKIRRRLKAIFHEENLYEQPYDCIVITKEPGMSLPFETLRDLLLKALNTPTAPKET